MAKKKKKGVPVNVCPLGFSCVNKGSKCGSCMNSGKGKTSYYKQKKAKPSKGSSFSAEDFNPIF